MTPVKVNLNTVLSFHFDLQITTWSLLNCRLATRFKHHVHSTIAQLLSALGLQLRVQNSNNVSITHQLVAKMVLTALS